MDNTLTPTAFTPSPVPVLLLKWTARLGSIASIGLLAAFAFGGGEPGLPTAREAIALALFPGAVVIGMLLGWWRPLVGGVVTVAGLALFYAWMAAWSGELVAGPWFLIFASPGILFLACGLLERARAARR